MTSIHGCIMPLAAGYYKGKAYQIEVIDYAGVKMIPQVAWAYYHMASAAAQAGLTLKVNSGWRSLEDQARLWAEGEAGKGAKASKPGHSNHQMGWALDINQAHDARVLPWLRANARSYDFYETVSGEPWHWEWRPPIA